MARSAFVQISRRHNQQDKFTPLTLQMYWALFMGVLAFWATDQSPREEDTLALLDQSLAMFVGWLTGREGATSNSITGA